MIGGVNVTSDRRILVTGASGFIGRGLVADLAGLGYEVRAASRTVAAPAAGVEPVRIGDLGGGADWRAALDGVSAVVHLAGPAHARFRETDLTRAIVDGSSALARQACAAGVRRFVLMSSIKAVTESSEAPLDECAEPRPQDGYGRAKRDAEIAVLSEASLAPVVLRPPLVHGPEARANVARLLMLANLPLPLPLADFTARRSVIALASVIAAVRCVLAAPHGPSGVFHLADQPALSIRELVAALRRGRGRSPGLFALPMVAALAPRVLRTSLIVDDARFRAAYGYGDRAHIGSAEALAATAAAWKAR
ncbi:MAG: NAD-dependent epimerase/dehydratase family protein [Hyphomonadaceae bacterium]|nr:NAD-dependent epimerase/dehydratase family protein [Hyphomonadaceae bacterium]